MGKIRHDIDLSKHLIKNGPKFCSHRLSMSSDQQVATIKPTLGAMALCYFYIVLGVVLLVLSLLAYFKADQQFDFALFVAAFGIAIGTFGASLLRPFLHPAKFDKTTQDFSNNNERIVELSNIRSLQLNDKVVMAGGGQNYPCYELNMLTANGRRINILNHDDLAQMRKDATILSQLLNIDYKEYLTNAA